MKISQELRDRAVELDRRYRSSWDARSIAHVLGIGHTTVAAILREARGPRPERASKPHDRRTRFLRRDVMWSSDFMKLPDGREMIKTMDEMSLFRLGWDAEKTETAELAVRHADSIRQRMGRWPLIWKYDHGSPFTSHLFQGLLARHKILAYPIPPRSPWVNGRNERDNREVRNWLIAVETAKLSAAEFDRDIDDGMMMLNYVKPRAVLSFRKSAEVYFKAPGIEEIPRDEFIAKVMEYEAQIGMMGTERTRRKAIRMAMQYWEVYEEWTQLPWWDKDVNRTRAKNVSF